MSVFADRDDYEQAKKTRDDEVARRTKTLLARIRDLTERFYALEEADAAFNHARRSFAVAERNTVAALMVGPGGWPDRASVPCAPLFYEGLLFEVCYDGEGVPKGVKIKRCSVLTPTEDATGTEL